MAVLEANFLEPILTEGRTERTGGRTEQSGVLTKNLNHTHFFTYPNLINIA